MSHSEQLLPDSTDPLTDLPSPPETTSPDTVDRRRFLQLAGAAAAATAGLGAAGLALPGSASAAPAAQTGGSYLPSTPPSRSTLAYQMRVQAAQMEMSMGYPAATTNGDEARYPKRIGNYSKGLPHNALGEVDAAAYDKLVAAAKSGKPADFEAIPMGGTRKLTNPQAGLAFQMQGADPTALLLPAAPAFASQAMAAQMAENYWQALARDIPFEEYGSNPLTVAAAADLTTYNGALAAPKSGAQVTPGTLFRGLPPGCATGPYISQFMWLPTPFGAEAIDRRMRTTVAGDDFMKDYNTWLAIQRGSEAYPAQTFDPTWRYVRNGRDLGEWVHIDVLFQAYFEAMLILFSLGAPFDAGNPYHASANQIGFGTLGHPYLASILCGVAKQALATVWNQKWYVHRYLRPEAMAGRVHNHKTGAASYPIHSQLLNSPVLTRIYKSTGTYLLPMAFPEGSPTHPSYGSGHATVAGACVTILKAFFDESWVIPNPVVSTSDGLGLVPYAGPALTVGGELNKLAANVAIGRNIAGVHWRCDANESLKLGESVAIRFLMEEKMSLNEKMVGYSLTKFDGTTVTV